MNKYYSLPSQFNAEDSSEISIDTMSRPKRGIVSFLYFKDHHKPMVNPKEYEKNYIEVKGHVSKYFNMFSHIATQYSICSNSKPDAPIDILGYYAGYSSTFIKELGIKSATGMFCSFIEDHIENVRIYDRPFSKNGIIRMYSNILQYVKTKDLHVFSLDDEGVSNDILLTLYIIGELNELSVNDYSLISIKTAKYNENSSVLPGKVICRKIRNFKYKLKNRVRRSRR